MGIPAIAINTNSMQQNPITIPGAPPLGSPHAPNLVSHVSSNHLNNYVEVEKHQNYQAEEMIAVLDEDI